MRVVSLNLIELSRPSFSFGIKECVDANNLGGPAAEGAANGPALQGSRCMLAMQGKQGQMQRLPPMRVVQEVSIRDLH